MNVYLCFVRKKCEVKQKSLFEATIKLVNEIGFASSSVSKIAKEANISPATIYIYHKNKEALLISTYFEIKKELSQTLFKDYDNNLPIRDNLKYIWFNGFEYASNHQGHLNFSQLLSNSPYSDGLDRTEIDKLYEPLENIYRRGVDQKILKNVDFELLNTFVIYPFIILSNKRLCSHIELNKKNIEKAFNLAWDAIKL